MVWQGTFATGVMLVWKFSWRADAQGIERFMGDLTAEKPPLAQIDKIKTELSGKNEYQNFTIIKSSQEAETSGSIIPPDISICNQCLKELATPKTPVTSTSLSPAPTADPLHHHRTVAIRPRKHHHARVSTVRFLPKRI